MALRAQELRRVCRLFWNKLLLSMCNTLKLSGLFVSLIIFFSIWGTGKISRLWFARGGGGGVSTQTDTMLLHGNHSLRVIKTNDKQNKTKKKNASKKKPSASSLKHDWTKRFHKISKKTSVTGVPFWLYICTSLCYVFFRFFQKRQRGRGYF